MENLRNITLVITLLCAFQSYAIDGGNSPDSTNNHIQQIVEQVIKGYGGKKLLQLKSMEVTDQYSAFRDGQSYRPNAIDMVNNHYTLTLNYKKKQNNFQRRYGSQNSYHIQHQQFNGEIGKRFYHNSSTYLENKNMTFASTDHRHQLLIDTNLAKLLSQISVKNPEHISYLGAKNIRGVMYERLKMSATNYPEMTLFIEQKTGLIKQMQRPDNRKPQPYAYHYHHPIKKQGISYAQSFYVTRNGFPYNASVSRSVMFNIDTATTFTAPKNYKVQPPTMDLSNMSVKKVADSLYISGKNWGFSLFYDTGDYFVAAGGYRGLRERFNTLSSTINTEKPLKYLVVSHHHLDHMGGIKEAEEMGVTFVTVASNIHMINELVGRTLPHNRFHIVETQGSFANNQVHVIDNPSSHANHNLVTYIKSAKLAFSADTYFSREETGSPRGSSNLKNFKRVLDNTGLEVEYLAAAHSNRVLTYQDLQQSVSSIAPPTVCPTAWKICAL